MILAGVTLNSLSEEGTIGKSKVGQQEYGKSSKNEEKTLEECTKYIDDNSNRNDEEATTNTWEKAGLTEGVVVYGGSYYINNDPALGWEDVNLQILSNGTLVFKYTYNGIKYEGNTNVNNCRVSGNQIYVKKWKEGNIANLTTFYFKDSSTCEVNEECYIYY